ncbi:hypothetical protein [Cellulosilyticum sp. I15G10I2]|uniref:hypothetical protein n=1 Tax=Cellulosilyticum sp. I15G10I2 TaxID=1892843 RepID=UPI00085C2A13|nr:hypothetical protein [Cellulosilyticum sp. I15G10I2]
MNKKQELLDFLQAELFNPIIDSPYISPEIKYDFLTILDTLKNFSAEGILSYFWNMMANDEVQMIFSNRLMEEGFYNYPELVDTFKSHFTYEWLLS